MSSPAKRQATKGPPATPKKHKLGKPQIPLSEQSTDVSSSASYPTPPSSPVPPHSANPVPPSPIKKSTRKACPTQKLIESIEQTPKRKPDKNNPKIPPKPLFANALPFRPPPINQEPLSPPPIQSSPTPPPIQLAKAPVPATPIQSKQPPPSKGPKVPPKGAGGPKHVPKQPVRVVPQAFPELGEILDATTDLPLPISQIPQAVRSDVRLVYVSILARLQRETKGGLVSASS